ncbi:MAG: ATP:cob(I)alamin adenosyltransferase [Candidatus Parcubacteria bacterium]|nr:MAG: ATP:cob(I)alamin adenosyltransferase [Candidatus Parcubacteria bacterium]
MYLYTKKGDRGKSLIGKNKIYKDNFILETLGELDELNSLLGVIKNYLKNYRTSLTQIQNDLFIIQANISYLIYKKFIPPKLKKQKVEKLEKEISKIEKTIKLPQNFIIPGKEINSAWLHYARTVIRRVERKIIRLSKRKKIEPTILIYLNRLSSYFYALALKEVYQKKLSEDEPNYL